MLEKILPYILATLTQHNRQKVVVGVDFQWSKDSWVHNLFRLYELVFWRREGLRREMSTSFDGINVIHHFYTWEAAIAHGEGLVREFLRTFKVPALVWVAVPQFVPVGAGAAAFSPFPYVLAIARDATGGTNRDSNGAATTTLTFSQTVTGSNLIFIGGFSHQVNEALTSMKWNTSETFVSAVDVFNTGSLFRVQLLYLINPTTGTHNVVTIWPTSTTQIWVNGMSYSGANQSGQPDSTASNFNTSNQTSITTTTTVVASNCWLVGYGHSQQTSMSAGAGTSINVVNSIINGTMLGVDSNGTVGTGSQSLIITSSAILYTVAIASIKPFLAVANSGFLMFM